MATTKEKWQEIANRGLQDKFDPATRLKFDEAVKRGLITMPNNVESALNPDVPGIEGDPNLSQAAPKPERSLGETLIGAGEAALTAATGATGGALGFAAGALEGVAKDILGDITQDEAQQIAQQRAAALTFEPRTEAGREFVGDISETLSVLPPVIGATPLGSLQQLVPNKVAINKIINNPSAKRKLLAEQVRQGNPNTDTVAKMLNASGELVTNKTSKRALNVLKKDLGDVNAPKVVSVIENMTPASKSQVSKMLNIIERGRKEPIFGQTNRPSDILGDSVANRAKAITTLNKSASKEIGDTAKALKNKSVDIQQSTNAFFDELSGLGVTFSRGDDGWVTPDFSRSKFVGGNQQQMSVLVNDLLKSDVGFESAHKLKRSIRDNIDFDKIGAGQLSNESQSVLKRLSSGIDSVLDDASPKYKKANERFAKTIDLKEKFDKLAGKDVDIFSDTSSKALGGKARRMVSNAESRVAIEQNILESDKVLGSLGVKFKDDIPSLNHVVTQLETAFKIEPPGSIQGRMQRAGANIAQGINPKGAAAEALADKIFNLNKPDFNKKIRAFRSLTNQGKK